MLCEKGHIRFNVLVCDYELCCPELLISHWSVEICTSIVPWGELTLRLNDVAVMFRLPLFSNHSAMGFFLWLRKRRVHRNF